MCEKFKKYVVPSYNISHDNKVKPEIRHIGVQYGASFSLLKLSPNWKPFEKGFNYLLTSMPINSFGKGNIKLLHYCGVNGYSNALKHFKHYFTD